MIQFEGKIKDLEHLQVIAQIPDSSWLWSRIMARVCHQVERLDDDGLLTHLPVLIDIASAYPYYRDRLFSACLTRYSNSRHRHAPHDRLKVATFEAWGNPQLRSKSNLWHHHVNESVCQMVLSWFARQDLEHFFSLLKGTANVDAARLTYWLRFVNQMSYTRIVIGTDAQRNSSPDYIQFRSNNKGRLALLDGGTSSDNAVIMQVGAYYFVEFSRTGNACYIHNAGVPGFNPEQRHLHLSLELKTTLKPVFVSKHGHMGSWQASFDGILARLGIHPDGTAPAFQRPAHQTPGQPTSPPTPEQPRIHRFPAPGPRSPRIPPSPVEKSDAEEEFMAELHEALKGVEHYISDMRSKGGALHVRLTALHYGTGKKLQLLGFQKNHRDPMHYWRSK